MVSNNNRCFDFLLNIELFLRSDNQSKGQSTKILSPQIDKEDRRESTVAIECSHNRIDCESRSHHRKSQRKVCPCASEHSLLIPFSKIQPEEGSIVLRDIKPGGVPIFLECFFECGMSKVGECCPVEESES